MFTTCATSLAMFLPERSGNYTYRHAYHKNIRNGHTQRVDGFRINLTEINCVVMRHQPFSHSNRSTLGSPRRMN